MLHGYTAVYPFICKWTFVLFSGFQLLSLKLLWIFLYKFLYWLCIFISVGQVPRSGLLKSYDGCMILHSYQQYMRLSSALHFLLHGLLFFCLFNGCVVISHCGFDYISLMTNNFEQFSSAYLVSIYLLWWLGCSVFLPI